MNDPTDGPGLVRSLLPVTYGFVVALVAVGVLILVALVPDGTQTTTGLLGGLALGVVALALVVADGDDRGAYLLAAAMAALAVVVNGSGPPAVRRHLQRSSS